LRPVLELRAPDVEIQILLLFSILLVKQLSIM
jgi:hypothetical protein